MRPRPRLYEKRRLSGRTFAECTWRNRLEIIAAARSLSVRGHPTRNTERRSSLASSRIRVQSMGQALKR
jgi:hypothetical protein